jgi:hypothetical protein
MGRGYPNCYKISELYDRGDVEQTDREQRLVGSVHVNAHDPAGAAREIDRFGGHPRIARRRPSDVIREHIRFATQPIDEMTARASIGTRQ